ncbi:MAG: GIY-YIG nuclease family protein [Patescibacteria group bacterium]|nr:GIY-YIG nuclease family protein [Patescibacteria group bacterium]
MFYVYVIRSTKKKYHYIGYTSNLRKRLQEHNSGKTKSIKHLIPFELIYYEAYNTDNLARKREINLKKNAAAKEDLFKRLEIS